MFLLMPCFFRFYMDILLFFWNSPLYWSSIHSVTWSSCFPIWWKEISPHHHPHPQSTASFLFFFPLRQNFHLLFKKQFSTCCGWGVQLGGLKRAKYTPWWNMKIFAGGTWFIEVKVGVKMWSTVLSFSTDLSLRVDRDCWGSLSCGTGQGLLLRVVLRSGICCVLSIKEWVS